MRFELIPWISIPGQIWMQVFITCTLIYMLWKYRKDTISLLFILLSWPRVFVFYGKTVENMYKIAMLLLCIYFFYQLYTYRIYQKRERWLLITFALFSIQFILSVFLYTQNTLTIVLSQYSRYVEILLLYFIVKYIIYNGKGERLLALFYDIGLMQIIISVFKMFAIGWQMEGLVGSFTIIGGAQGTTIPILWFINLWYYRKGKFGKWDWLYILGLLLIGFTTGKRAVMFILPVVVAAFMIYVPKLRLKGSTIAITILLVPLLLYLGVRLTPSFNPEHKIWGSFDWEYAIGYAETYQFGEEGLQGQTESLEQVSSEQIQYSGGVIGSASRQIEAEGRGGATIALIRLLIGNHETIEQDWWGLGFKNMYGIDYDTFDKLPLTIHINHKGSATGVFQSYVTTGLLGALCTILFSFAFLFYCRHKRIKYVLLAICAWEYFMYTGILFRTPMFMAVLFVVIHSVNYERLMAKTPRRQTSHGSIKPQLDNPVCLEYPPNNL